MILVSTQVSFFGRPSVLAALVDATGRSFAMSPVQLGNLLASSESGIFN